MNVDPRQQDPQYQSPLEGDSQRASQFGMGSQADAPLQQQGMQGMVPGTGAIDPNTIIPGADVFGTDGKRVGTVQEVYEDSFLVQKGIFFVHDYFVPLSVVTQVTSDRVDLGLSSDAAQNQDWTQRPGVASIGRGVQADSTTDTQRGGLNTQNDVNPSMFGTPAAGGEASMNPNESAGALMTNQAPNSQMGIPTEAGQNDRTGTAGPGAEGSDIDASRLTPADQVQDVPQTGVPAKGTSGQPYSAGAMPERGAGDEGMAPGHGTAGASLTGQHSGGEQVYVAGQGPGYGTMPSADTPLQQQTPAPSSAGRTGSADVTQRATERGMQGINDPNPDNLSGAPEDPRSVNDWDPSEQGVDNP